MMILGVLYRILSTLLELYGIASIIYALMSWVPQAYSSKFGQFIGRLVSPLMNTIEDHVPSIFGLSFAPVIALLVVGGLQWLLRVIFSLF